jgi:erythrin-vacuolar iron transport family protein
MRSFESLSEREVLALANSLRGLGHTLPYLIPAVMTATAVAIGVVVVELGVIAWVRHKYMDTPLAAAIFQVVLGGILVFFAGVLIGIS